MQRQWLSLCLCAALGCSEQTTTPDTASPSPDVHVSADTVDAAETLDAPSDVADTSDAPNDLADGQAEDQAVVDVAWADASEYAEDGSAADIGAAKDADIGPDIPGPACKGAAYFEVLIAEQLQEQGAAVLAHENGELTLAVTRRKSLDAQAKAALFRYNAAGLEMWTFDYVGTVPNSAATFDLRAVALAPLSDGAVGLLAQATHDLSGGPYLRTVGADGMPMSKQYAEVGAQNSVHGLIFDAGGVALVAGRFSSSPTNPFAQAWMAGWHNGTLADLGHFGASKSDACTFFGMVQGTDGSYTMVGTCVAVDPATSKDHSLFVQNADAQGGDVWHKLFSFGKQAEGNAVALRAGGGYAIAGLLRDASTQDTDALLLMVDAQGNEISQAVFDNGPRDAFVALAPLPDGGCVLAGRTGTEANSDGLLVRTDALGNRQWQRSFGGAMADTLTGVAVVGPSGFALSGTFDGQPGGSSSAWLARSDAWGHTTCKTSGACGAKGIAECSDAKPCTADDCDGASGKCTHTNLPDGTACGAGASCTAGQCL